ncbi:hypothetical protein QFC22_005839 [Naganishia vaughanmartiniae]|uniref:Uncharacterized protein n=1 Tax=Naganishia vaughanmartiniae TaxID=1424756 RepID=A0ACC2WS59_9TREE|nr:hypothetical protein QFC22_005839 [Naganishia vaughanmartiniae]
MTSNVLIPHVRLRIFRHYSALAGAHTRFSSPTTASSASPMYHSTKSASSSVALNTLLPEWKAGDTNPAGAQDKKEWTINGGQDMNAGQKWNGATVSRTLSSRDAASSVTRSALGDSNESGPDTRIDVSDEHFGANHPKGYSDADTHDESFDSSLEAGDPFNCDHIDMRLAKARSKYAWVTCQTGSEKFVLQAQGLLYFYIERIHDAENVAYNVGYALKRNVDAGRGGTFLKGANDFRSRFNNRNNVGRSTTREDAFRLAEILIEEMITDKKLLKTRRAGKHKACGSVRFAAMTCLAERCSSMPENCLACYPASFSVISMR